MEHTYPLRTREDKRPNQTMQLQTELLFRCGVRCCIIHFSLSKLSQAQLWLGAVRWNCGTVKFPPPMNPYA